MAADELALLFKLRGDPSGLKAANAEARASINQLTQSFGTELTQAANASQKAFQAVGGQVNQLVRQQLPVIGPVFTSVTDGLQQIGAQAARNAPQLATLGQRINDVATASGKSRDEVRSFLQTFRGIEDGAQRVIASMRFLGKSFSTDLNSQLEKSREEMIAAETAAAGLGARLAALAGPVGIAVAALAALAAVSFAIRKQFFDMARDAARTEGALADLSQQTGITVETLSALEIIAKQNGLQIGSLVASLGLFQRKLEDARDPTSKAAETLRELGVTAEDTEEALQQTLQGLFRLGEGSEQTATALELFGRSGRALLAVLKQTGGDLEAAKQQFRDLGILIEGDTARAADDFNDQLELLNFQIRAVGLTIGREVMPTVLQAIQSLSRTIRDNREAFSALARVVGFFAGVLGRQVLDALNQLNTALTLGRTLLNATATALQPVVDAYERIARAAGLISAAPLPSAPEPTVAGDITVPIAGRAAKQSKSDRERLQQEIDEQQKLLVIQQRASEEIRRRAVEREGQARRDFEAGKIRRAQEVEETINAAKEKSDAEIAILEKTRRARLLELTQAFDDIKKRQELQKQIQAIDDDIAEERLRTAEKAKDERAKFQREERQALLEHEKARLDILEGASQARIQLIESEVRAGIKSALDGAREIERIENTSLLARRDLLQKELKLAGVDDRARQQVLDKLADLENKKTVLFQQQAERRARIQRQSAETAQQIATEDLDTLLTIQRIRGNSIIALIQSQADRRLRTEENAAREILRIRRELIEQEIEATKIRLERATPGNIPDENERLRVQAELNNKLRVLTEERIALEQEGLLEIEDARERDLQNTKEYADEISRIRERIIDIERDTGREVINQMILGFARRKDIVRAQAELDVREAEDRHRRNREDLRREQAEVAERLAGLQGFLRAVESTGKRELTIYQDAIKARVTALNQQKELNQQEREELAQHQRILSSVRTQRDIQDYEKGVRARVEALERQGDLNQQEQEELAQHYAILQALRQRDEQSIRAGTLQARVEILERQGSLNAEEEAELQRHYAELAEIRGSEDLGGVIERRIAVLTEQKRLNAEEERELQRHQETLSALRVRTDVQDYQRAIEVRVEALGRQKDLNSQEQQELRQHQEILQALREREQRLAQVDVLQARISVLERQKSLNRSEQEELKRHYGELKRIRESDTLVGVIERRVAVLSRQKDLNAEEEAELRRHQQVLSGLRSETQVQDYRRALQVRVDALARQKELNAEEQRELQEHQNILQALRERDERIIRITGIQARVEVLQKQKELNAEEQAELEGHLNTLTQLRNTEDLETSIQRRVDQLNKQRELNAQEQAELKSHQATLDAIRGRAGVDVYAQQLQARVEALRQQGELNIQEQSELRSHLEILDAIRLQGERQRRIATLQNRVETLRQQRQLNEQEKQDLERQQAELSQLRDQEDFRAVIQRRVDYLRRQTELNRDEQEELRKHEAVLRAVREGGLSFAAAIRARVEYLRSLTELTAEEQAELENHLKIITQLEDRSKIYEDAIQKRIEFLEKQKELNAEEKAELERHRAEIETIERRRRLEAKEADPIGRLDLDVDNLKEFASVIENSIVPLGELLTTTFLQVADAIGQTVTNWVLLGETGPAVMRKILAQALASLAKEAAVNAIKELALGFATLFFNPAESAAHFKAAALWAAVGGAAAVAGRATAGNLFKPTAGGGAQGTSTGPQQLNPLTLQRNAGPGAPPQFAPQIRPQEVNLNVKVSVNDGQFAKAITATVVNDVNNSGPIREVIANDGNLSRG